MKKIIAINISVVVFLTFLFLSTSSAISPVELNLKLLKRSNLDLLRAIEIAVNKIPGQPIEAHLESKPDRQEPVFKVTILKSRAAEIVVVSIDGRRGRIIDIATLPSGVMPSFQAETGSPIAPVEIGPAPVEMGPAPVEMGPAPAEEGPIPIEESPVSE
jgi:hypothetical protein